MQENKTCIVYESPHRIQKLINELFVLDPKRQICISREISKLYETHLRGSASELKQLLETHPIKGEIVVTIEKCTDV